MCVRVCLCASVCTRYAYAECVLYHETSMQQHSSSTTPAVFQALAFRQVVTVYVCGWCTAGDRTTKIFSHPMQQSNTHRRTLYQVYEAHSSSKCSNSSYEVHIIGMPVSPFRLATHPGYQSEPHPEGKPCNKKKSRWKNKKNQLILVQVGEKTKSHEWVLQTRKHTSKGSWTTWMRSSWARHRTRGKSTFGPTR